MHTVAGKRLLVTGAAGFVGANLTRELVDLGADVHILVRPSTSLWRIGEIIPRLTIHLGDITCLNQVQGIVKKVQPEALFHLAVHRAGPSTNDRLTTLQANVLGTFNLLEAESSLDYCRFIYVGGSLEYGSRKKPLRESDRLEPSTFFGATKAASTLLCQQFARANSRPVVMLRLFSVYGYWEAPTRLIPTAIMAALRNREIALTAPGYRRDLIFIEDVVEACLLAIEAKKAVGKIINVGSGEQWSNEQVVEMVQAVSGRRFGVRVGEYPPRPSDTPHWVADNRKAQTLLGWKPRHSLRRGLEKTIAWFRNHQEDYEA